MNTQPSNAIDKKKEEHNALVISFLAIRKWIGLLGLLLPFVLVAGSLLFSECDTIMPSISEYYYTNMRNYFVGILCMVGMFLISYKGYDGIDAALTNVSGVLALMIAFFPTKILEQSNNCLTKGAISSSDVTNIIHLLSAGSFFLVIAYISGFVFTKSKGEMTPEKIIRNKIYRTCGITIAGSVAILILLFLFPQLRVSIQDYKPVILLETIALIAFGISWLTKGKFLVEDEKEPTLQ